MTRRIVVLGSTGSIGVQALDVLAQGRGAELPLQLVGLAAGSSWQPVLAQASAFSVDTVYFADDDAAVAARAALGDLATDGTIHIAASIDELLDRAEPDVVLNAVVGFAGLAASVATLERGIDLALANKESLVAAGELCLRIAERTGARIIPVDSEHSALQQCMSDSPLEEISSLVLTASGGPFRGMARADLANVSVAQALAHPTWNMGGKISIDSATLMNKGLELIEAMVLFDLPADAIETIVHPLSIVHALVRHRDGPLLAHLGWPDMRVPIAWALHWPVRPEIPARRLDLAQMPALTFEEPDLVTFRCLPLARDAARQGGGAPCVLNAANEVAVERFLAGQLSFLKIADVVDSTLQQVEAGAAPDSIEAAAELDARARDAARAHAGVEQ
ncbi:MAG: 1-deoxy-D-xylulose-5-phosphate reductoisomerase [Thermoleophilia bacterium]|nr:1-deoxy-D-xylulose-5-phosphate reductoisomerase [Thermoleophilia bacterium]